MDKRKDKTTLERVISCIGNIATSLADGKITEDMTVRGDVLEESDYLDFVELIMDLEEEFDIEITEADAEAITTVGSLVKIVDGKTRR